MHKDYTKFTYKVGNTHFTIDATASKQMLDNFITEIKKMCAADPFTLIIDKNHKILNDTIKNEE